MGNTLHSAGPSAERGFTLVEVLTTLAVLGVSLSLVVPSLAGVAQSSRSASAINELVATLHIARSEAIARNSRVVVCPSEDGLHCGDVTWDAGWIRFVDTNGDYRPDADKPVLGASPALAALRIHTDTFDTALGFGPSGGVVVPDGLAAGGDFTFCPGATDQGAQVLVLSALGQPILTRQRADGRQPDCSPG